MAGKGYGYLDVVHSVNDKKTLYLSLNSRNMKNFFFATLFLLVTTMASAQQATLSALLVEFETAVKWEAVDPQWKTRRANWINEVKIAKTPVTLGKLLAEFETYVTWAAVDKRWEKARDTWIKACVAPASYSNVSKLMVEFESYTKWEGVTEVWKKRREGWLTEASSI